MRFNFVVRRAEAHGGMASSFRAMLFALDVAAG